MPHIGANRHDEQAELRSGRAFLITLDVNSVGKLGRIASGIAFSQEAWE
jgi:hypothetical protein